MSLSRVQMSQTNPSKVQELLHTLINCRLELKNEIDMLNKKLSKTDEQIESVLQSFNMTDSSPAKNVGHTSFALDSPYVSFTNDDTSFRNLNSLNENFLKPTKNNLATSHIDVSSKRGKIERFNMKKSISLAPDFQNSNTKQNIETCIELSSNYGCVKSSKKS